MLFTLPGCASIYYGDEAEIDGTVESMEGCRYPMPWDKDIEATDSFKLYSALSKIKTTEAAFKDGGFKVLWDNDYVFAFARFTPEEVFVTVCSADTSSRKIEIPAYIFGKSFAQKPVPEKDVLGAELHSEMKDGVLLVEVPAGKSYLIKL